MDMRKNFVNVALLLKIKYVEIHVQCMYLKKEIVYFVKSFVENLM